MQFRNSKWAKANLLSFESSSCSRSQSTTTELLLLLLPLPLQIPLQMSTHLFLGLTVTGCEASIGRVQFARQSNSALHHRCRRWMMATNDTDDVQQKTTEANAFEQSSGILIFLTFFRHKTNANFPRSCSLLFAKLANTTATTTSTGILLPFPPFHDKSRTPVLYCRTHFFFLGWQSSTIDHTFSH